MWGRAIGLGLFLAGVGSLPMTAGALGASSQTWHQWVGAPGDIAGQGVVSRGEAIWSNYLFDDYGANVDGFASMNPDLLIGIVGPHAYPGDPTHPLGFAPSGNIGRFRHTGDYGYPPDHPCAPAVSDPLCDNNSYQNVANVAEVRMAADASNVYLRFALSNLGGDPQLATRRPDSTVIGVAIDTNPGQGTGGGAWPFQAHLTSSGWKSFLTVWGTGGALTTPNGTAEDLVSDVGGSVREDLAANTIDVRVPLAAFAAVGQNSWRLLAGAGRWDPAQHVWAVPSLTTTQSTSPGNLMLYPRVYELPFHHNEPNSLWNDTKQANDLAKNLTDPTSVDSDSWTVDVGQLHAGATMPVPCQSGPRDETFTSSLGYGPGLRTEKGMVTLPTQNGGAANLHNVNYIYRWHVQPLAVVLPPTVCNPTAPPPSLDYFFHPANVNHNAWFVAIQCAHVRCDWIHDPPLDYSYVTALASRYNRITAAGLAKTEGWNYGDAPGEEVADLNAFQKLTSEYHYNPDHVRVTGMSGRNGAYFFAETWPDKVASMVTVSNHDADSPKIANLRNTPNVFMHGTSFLELQSSLPSYPVLDSHMNALGYQYLHITWNARGHDINLLNDSYALVEPWTSAPRIHPARITYYVDPKDRRADLPLFPGVDWVRGLTLSNSNHPGQIDLTDLAKADQLPVRQTRFDCFFLNAATADYVEYHGLSNDSPDVVRARMPDVVSSAWTATQACTPAVMSLARPALANGIGGSVQNLSEVTVDGAQMGLDPARPIDVSGIKSTGPLAVHVNFPTGQVIVHRSGVAAAISLPNSSAGGPGVAWVGLVLIGILTLFGAGFGLRFQSSRHRR